MSKQQTVEDRRQNAILKHNSDDVTRNLSAEYGDYTGVRTQQEKLLNKYNQSITLQNKKIMNQLHELQDIQSHISTRDSLVKGNNQYIDTKAQI